MRQSNQTPGASVRKIETRQHMHVARRVPHPAVCSSVQLGFTPQKQWASSDVPSHDGRSPPRAHLPSSVAERLASSLTGAVLPLAHACASAAQRPRSCRLPQLPAVLPARLIVCVTAQPAITLPAAACCSLLHLAAGRQLVTGCMALQPTNTYAPPPHCLFQRNGAADAQVACCAECAASGAGCANARRSGRPDTRNGRAPSDGRRG